MLYDEPKWTVYEHISPSGKKYIGITGQDPKVRWKKNGVGYERNPHFWAAIQKYGWDNIQHVILFTGLQKKYADIYEIELIALFKTTEREYGYNMLKGGRLGLAKSCYTDEFRNRMSKIRKGKLMGRDNYKSRPVVCLNTRRHFACLMEAERETGINRNCIVGNCNGKQKYAGITNDGKFLRWMWEEEYNNCSEQEISDILNSYIIPVVNVRSPGFTRKVICLNNKKTFDSAKSAADFYNLKQATGIIKCCTNVREFSGKSGEGESLKWMYYDDYISLSEEEKLAMLNFKRSHKKTSIPTKVICLNTLEIFNTCKETGKYTTNKDGKGINKAINNHTYFAFHPITKEKLYWYRLNDYELLSNKEKENLKNQFYTGSFLLPEK